MNNSSDCVNTSPGAPIDDRVHFLFVLEEHLAERILEVPEVLSVHLREEGVLRRLHDCLVLARHLARLHFCLLLNHN